MKRLSDEDMERLRTFGLHGKAIPILHVEAIASKADDERDKEWVKWGDSECPHYEVTPYTIMKKNRPIKRYCPECWQELKQTIPVQQVQGKEEVE